MLKVTPQNAKSLTNLLYATLETGDNNKILNIISKVSPSLHEIMKQPSLLGNNTFENMCGNVVFFRPTTEIVAHAVIHEEVHH